jgi:hypothetical protein
MNWLLSNKLGIEIIFVKSEEGLSVEKQELLEVFGGPKRDNLYPY